MLDAEGIGGGGLHAWGAGRRDDRERGSNWMWVKGQVVKGQVVKGRVATVAAFGASDATSEKALEGESAGVMCIHTRIGAMRPQDVNVYGMCRINAARRPSHDDGSREGYL